MKMGKGAGKASPASEKWNTPNQQYLETAVRKGECMVPSYSESRHVDADLETMARNRCVAVSSHSPCLDAYKVLRTRIRGLMEDRGLKTLMVTSPMPGEGKTLTSVNLALTCSKEFDQTVLLMDCDFRRQDVHTCLGIESDRGLMDYLVREVPLNELIIWPGIEKMTFVSGGTTVQESTEIMGSSRMRRLVEEVKNRYPDRLVIFDTPPVLAGADAIVFAPLVDSVIMVVDYGKTPMNAVSKAVELLPRDKLLGLVLNREDTGRAFQNRG